MNNKLLSLVGMPPITSFDSYKNYVNHLPLLNEDEEMKLLLEFKNKNSLVAAQKLIISQLKTVLLIASKFRGYGLPQEDLVQEGNIGLMKAVKNFNTNYKVRLYTYAMVWIKSEIQSYILKNWKIVKIATTKNLKKLFFNFKQIQKELINLGVSKQELIQNISKKLNVSEEESREMQSYFSSEDLSIDADDDNSTIELPCYGTPESIYQDKNDSIFYNTQLLSGLKTLNSKQQKVIEARYYCDEKKTHKDIAIELNVSSERVRQIEQEALTKLKNHILKSS